MYVTVVKSFDTHFNQFRFTHNSAYFVKHENGLQEKVMCERANRASKKERETE